MIIHFSSTLIILSLIRRHIQKQITHIPIPVAAENRDLIIFVRTYAEFIRKRGRLPAQFFGVGGNSLSWMGHGNCMSLLVQVMNSCGGNMIMEAYS